MDPPKNHSNFTPISGMPSVSDVMQNDDSNMRSLLREAHIMNTGTVAANTASGAHFTADFILDALEERSRKHTTAMNAASVRISQRERRVSYPKSLTEIAQLLRSSSRRKRLAGILRHTRKSRFE